MKIEIKLFAYFRDNRFIKEVRDYPEKTAVGDILAELTIAPEEVGVTMINGRHCQLETELSENDSLGIFPMIGGG
jgi:molybdopterin converting factor small subunit